jgi:NADPH:quinone reductase-like Zn-dependent oxidoreductase
VLKPGGKLISISGPPDPDFAKQNGHGWLLQQLMRLLSSGIRRKSRRRGISYSFLFMTANGGQLGKITSLIEAGDIRPVVDRSFRSREPMKRWPMSKRVARRARWSLL